MEDRQAIDSELHMCVDELRMLQAHRSSRVANIKKIIQFDYLFKLMGTIEHLNTITEDVLARNPFLYPVVALLCEVITRVTAALAGLDINNVRDWPTVLKQIKRLNDTVTTALPVARYSHTKLFEICKALIDGTKIESESAFLRTLPDRRDGLMLTILSSIGVNLFKISKDDGEYFGFLGQIGKQHMNAIIELLRNK